MGTPEPAGPETAPPPGEGPSDPYEPLRWVDPDLTVRGFLVRYATWELVLLALTLLHFTTEDYGRYTPGLPDEWWVVRYFVVLTATGGNVQSDAGFTLGSLVLFLVIYGLVLLVGCRLREYLVVRGLVHVSQVLRFAMGFLLSSLAVT